MDGSCFCDSCFAVRAIHAFVSAEGSGIVGFADKQATVVRERSARQAKSMMSHPADRRNA